MKRFYGFVVFVWLLAPALFAQEHYTEGPIWRIQLIRVKPTHMDDYLTSLQKSTKPFIDEEKKQGMIVDYKVFLKETKNNPDDWDICVAIQYKDYAAMDGLSRQRARQCVTRSWGARLRRNNSPRSARKFGRSSARSCSGKSS